MKKTLLLLLVAIWVSGPVMAAPVGEPPGPGYEWVSAADLVNLPVWTLGVPDDLNVLPYYNPSTMKNSNTAFELSVAPPKAGRMGGAWVYKNPLCPIWQMLAATQPGKAVTAKPVKSIPPSPGPGYSWVPLDELASLPVWSYGVPKDLNELPYYNPNGMTNPATAFELSVAPPKPGRAGAANGGMWVYKNPLSPIWKDKATGKAGNSSKTQPNKSASAQSVKSIPPSPGPGYVWVPLEELASLPIWSYGVPKDLNELPYYNPNGMTNPATAFELSVAPPKPGRAGAANGGMWVYKNPLSPMWK